MTDVSDALDRLRSEVLAELRSLRTEVQTSYMPKGEANALFNAQGREIGEIKTALKTSVADAAANRRMRWAVGIGACATLIAACLSIAVSLH